MEDEGNRGHSSEGDTHLGPGGSEWFLVCYVYTGTFSLFQTIVHFINCRMIINECAIMIYGHIPFLMSCLQCTQDFHIYFSLLKPLWNMLLRMLTLTFYIWI